MASAARRRNRNSSDESSGGASSEEEDTPSIGFDRSITSRTGELTLKDDEDPIDYQAPLPEEEGK